MPEPEVPDHAATVRTITLPGMSTSLLSAASVLNGVVYTSGQVGRDAETAQAPSDFAGQMHRRRRLPIRRGRPHHDMTRHTHQTEQICEEGADRTG